MKKKIVLILATLMCVSLCACGGSKTTSDKKDLVNKDLTISDLENMTVDEMKQYYNADELIGTPTIESQYVSSKGSDAETFSVSREIYNDRAALTFEKEYYIENTIGLGECICKKYCIFVDNNTPDNYEDDQFAFVFYWVRH